MRLTDGNTTFATNTTVNPTMPQSENNTVSAVETTNSNPYQASEYDIQETVKFHDSMASYSKIGIANESMGIPICEPEKHTHSIENFLARPVIIHSSSITTVTGAITSLSIDNYLANNSVAAKLANFGYMRCSINYKVTINASPFAMGRALGYSSPYEVYMDPTRVAPVGKKEQLTSYPHIEVDFGSQESPTMTIPYCGMPPWVLARPGESMNLWSQFFLEMINPLKGPNTVETASLTVWAWLSDLQLSIPVAESGNETSAKTDGIISGKAAKIGAMARLMDGVPIVGTVAKDVAWVADLVGGVSSLFGLERPLSDASVHPFSNVPAMGFTNCENVDGSVVLGLRPTNKVTCEPIINLSTTDPMAINAFACRDTIVQTIAFATTDAIDTILINKALNPRVWTTSLTSMLAGQYAYWRGGFAFRLSAVKNGFYSGRLSIEFHATGVIPPSFSPAAPAVVWDLRQEKEIYIRIPYVAPTRFLVATEDIGNLVIRVINPLKVNDTLPTSIDINLSMCGAPDLSFAKPRPTTLTWAQAGDALTLPTPAPMEACSLYGKSFPLLDNQPTTNTSNSILMGEPSTSIHDIIKRFTAFDDVNVSAFRLDPHWFDDFTSDNAYFNMSRGYRFHRGSMRFKIQMLRRPADATGSEYGGSVFAYARVTSKFSGVPVPWGTPIATPPVDSSLIHTVRLDLDPFLEIQLPYYSTLDRMLNTNLDYLTTEYEVVDIFFEWNSTNHVVPPVVRIWSAAGDDFSFSYPCGLPSIT